jgi:hypothetical protein
MDRQTELEFQYDQAGKMKSGRAVTKSLRLNYDYYSNWFDNPANATKQIKIGNSYHYPGGQFPSFKEFKHSSTFKQRAESVAHDYVSQRTDWEIDRNTGTSIGRRVTNKHGEDWSYRWGKRFVRRIAKVLKAKGMK